MTLQLLNFRLADSELQVRFGNWVVRRIRFDDIEVAGVTPGSKLWFTWNEHWCNFWPLRFVVLRRKSGWVRTFIINPPDPERFLEDLKRKVPHLP